MKLIAMICLSNYYSQLYHPFIIFTSNKKNLIIVVYFIPQAKETKINKSDEKIELGS
jgi:hypothetical protein